LYNLKDRHGRGLPYTRTGDIIIAVNPFQWFTDIYTEQVRNRYSRILVWENTQDGGPDPREEVEPHVYETSSLCYTGLAFGGLDQSILVSGESGAGKTETVKIAMNHIASCQQGPNAGGMATSPILERVVRSNPLLEAFGNAKTGRNDNSSRFGKYIQLQFDMGTEAEQQFRSRDKATCTLAGSRCEAYLLEKNRVTTHEPSERSYHIFYQIIAGKTKTKYWSKLAGTTNESFNFIGYTDTDTIEKMHDTDHFDNTVKVLGEVGVDDDKLMTLMQAIIMVMQLGNITFEPRDGDEDQAEIKSKKDFADLCELMGIDPNVLEVCLTERTMKTRNETYKVPLNPKVARDACESFAKEIYGRAFLWLVRAINDATAAEVNYKSGTMDHFGIIGLLDIFGFESFPRNRFEQLCINYCNEKLQAKFTSDIFRSVMDEYMREGIPLDEIKYDDNSDVLDLIEGKTGLLAMLNEECVRPKGEDQAFVTKAIAANKKSACLFANKTNRRGFGIHHYAGKVMYDAEGFVASNQETLPADLSEAASLSTNEILMYHMTNDACSNFEKKKVDEPGKGGAPKRAKSNLVSPTVWAKYKGQLASLMTMLLTTNSRYIRCIKPNKPKKPILTQHITTMEQLRCAGVVAAVTLSRSAFPNQLANSVVKFKFWQMWDSDKYPSKGTNDMDKEVKLKHDCEALLTCCLAPLAEVNSKTGKPMTISCCGKTKSYFKFGALEYLEAQRAAGLDKHAVQMQRVARTFLIRKKIGGNAKARKESVFILQRFVRRMAAKAEAQKEVVKAKADQEKNFAKRQKAAEEKAFADQLAAEIEEREYSASKEYKKYDGRAEEIDGQIKEAEARYKERLDEAQDRVKAAKEETSDLQDKLGETGVAANEPAKQAAGQKIKLEESGKLIAFLQKENKKLKSANDKAKKEMKKVKATNEKLVESNESAGQSFEMLNSQSKKMGSTTSDVNAQIEKFKKDNAKLREDLRSKQSFYNAEAQIRLQYQKTLAQILDVFQDNCKDADLVEDVVCVALECESEAKALLAMAEANSPGM
jgi:myosin-5